MGDWCTIESDPGVFTELIQRIGVKGVQVDEIYSNDKESMDAMKPIHGLIFLFKWRKEADTRAIDHNAPVFFAKQVITNACGTQAILSVLLNTPGLDVGEELSNFKSFANELPPDMRGLAIEQMDVVRIAHNSFRRPEPLVMESKASKDDDEDVFHFIGFVPSGNKVYELDGLKEGPICLGTFTDDWLTVARQAVQERIERYSAQEVKFNLLAIVKDRVIVLEERKTALTKKRDEIKNKTGAYKGKKSEELATAESDVAAQLTQVAEELLNETDKKAEQAVENTRRKHNYIPLVFNLCKILAKQGKLTELLEASKKATAEKAAAKKASEEKDKAKKPEAKK